MFMGSGFGLSGRPGMTNVEFGYPSGPWNTWSW
jgi:hypothetical protein